MDGVAVGADGGLADDCRARRRSTSGGRAPTRAPRATGRVVGGRRRRRRGRRCRGRRRRGGARARRSATSGSSAPVTMKRTVPCCEQVGRRGRAGPSRGRRRRRCRSRRPTARKPAKVRALPTHHSRWSMPPSDRCRRQLRGGVPSSIEAHAATPSRRSRSRPSQKAFTPSSISRGAGGGSAPRRTRARRTPRPARRRCGRRAGPRPCRARSRRRAAASGHSRVLERLEPGDELLPEAGGRPVLHREAGALGDRGVLGAVDARAARRRSAASVACRGAACRGSSKPSPSGAAKRSSHSKWAAPKRKRPPSTVPSVATRSGSVVVATRSRAGEDDAELVEEDLLAGPVGVEVGRVDDLAELGFDEEVAEHRELLGEVADLAPGGLALGEPAGVRVVGDDAVTRHERVDTSAECVEVGGSERQGDPPFGGRVVHSSEDRTCSEVNHSPGEWSIRADQPALW